MKRLISVVLSLCLLAGLGMAAFASGEVSGGSAEPEAGAPITLTGDITGMEDAAEFILPKLSSLMEPDGELEADRPVSRAEFCWMFNRMMGIAASDVPTFADIPEDAYYRNAVGFLEHFGVVAGTESGDFEPDEPLTREEAFVIIANFFTAFENVKLVDSTSDDYFARYTDADEIKPEHRDAVATMVQGDIAWSSSDVLRPGDKITVIEAMDLLYRSNAAKSSGSNIGKKDIPAQFKDGMTAEIYVEDDVLNEASSEMGVVQEYGITSAGADGLRLEVRGDNRNAVLALGEGTDFELTNAEVESWSNSHGDGNEAVFNGDNYGVGSIVCAGAGGTVTVRDSRLVQHGVGSNAATATVNGTVNLYDCCLETTDTGSRTLNTTNNSAMNLYRCEVVAAGWGALSTDTSAGSVNVYAEDSSFTVKNGRYAAYSDGGCMLTLRNCSLHSNADGVVCTGTGSLDFTNVSIVASDADGEENYAVRVTNVQSDPSEVAYLTFTGGSIHNLAGAVFTVHSANAEIAVSDTELVSDTGVLIDVSENLWMDHPVPGAEDSSVTGVNITLTGVEASGDVLFSDPDHDMTLTLDGSVIDGDIVLGETARTLTLCLLNGGEITGVIPEEVRIIRAEGEETLVLRAQEVPDVCALLRRVGQDRAA